MHIAYLDCFAGIAGDMFLGALLESGVPRQTLDEAVSALGLNASLKLETVDRSGISSTKVHVFEGELLAEDAPKIAYASGHTHPHPHGHSHVAQPSPTEPVVPHVHGRSLLEIRKLLREVALAPEVAERALRVFETIGEAEAKVHNVSPDKIHFHEVGSVDAIVDIVASCAGIVYLESVYPGLVWHCSPINVGGGTVVCAHGKFPVPAPAVLHLLRNIPTYSAHIQKELTTPTGAALLHAIQPVFGPQPPMLPQSVGYGAGSRNPENFPNVLRLILGTSADPLARQEITVLETAVDDATPQLVAHVAEQALHLGALDVMLTPVLMKKGRPGTLITVLCDASHRGQMEQLLLRETTTLGIRVRTEERVILDRTHVKVSTPYGDIRIKLGLSAGEVLNALPEYEDCRARAAATGASLKEVTQAAIAAYRTTIGRT